MFVHFTGYFIRTSEPLLCLPDNPKVTRSREFSKHLNACNLLTDGWTSLGGRASRPLPFSLKGYPTPCIRGMFKSHEL